MLGFGLMDKTWLTFISNVHERPLILALNNILFFYENVIIQF